MILKYTVFIAFFFSSLCFSKVIINDWQICNLNFENCIKTEIGSDLGKSALLVNNKNSLIYRTKINSSLFKENNWLFLGEVADSAEVKLNGKIILNFSGKNGNLSYIRSNSVSLFLPPEMINEKENLIDIKVTDLNGTLFGLRSIPFLGNYKEVNNAVLKDWSLRVGSNLLSAFSTLILSIVTIIFFINYNFSKFNYLAVYALVCCLYLISFSEIPRQFIDPTISSAPLHFSLRLLHDFTFLLFLIDLNKERKKYFFYAIIIYPILIFFLWVIWFFYSKEYFYFLKYMQIFSIFIQLPVFYGLIRSYVDKKFQLVYFFIILNIFQLNDLLNFWEVIRTVYLVRWYPPFVIVYFLYLIFKIHASAIRKKEIFSLLGRLTAQVAHDIRSPLAALEMIKNEKKLFNNKNSEVLFYSAVTRIQDIANDLLRKNRELVNDEKLISSQSFKNNKINVFSTPYLAFSMVEEVISEKRHEYKASNIKINFNVKNYSSCAFILVNRLEFKRVLSNLINNSVEAILNDGKINLTLMEDKRKIKLFIEDDGIGISKENLSRLNHEEFSFGKKVGNGLGLSYAKEVLNKYEGEFEIDSKLNEGTKIILTFKKAEYPKWFSNNLTIKEKLTIFILDDDWSIHQLWLNKFSNYIDSNKISVVHVLKIHDFHNEYTRFNNSKSILFLCDYKLDNETQNGLDLIKAYGLESQSVLVTSCFDNEKLQNDCNLLSVKIIPKSIIRFVNVVVT